MVHQELPPHLVCAREGSIYLSSSVGSLDLLYHAVRPGDREEGSDQDQEPMKPVHQLLNDGASSVMLMIIDPEVSRKDERQWSNCEMLALEQRP